MQRLLQEKMQKYYQKDEFSFAYGSASSSKKNFKDIKQVINLADEKMYNCKKKQKANRR